MAGQTDPTLLGQLAQGRLRQKGNELEQALVGLARPHQRFLLDEAIERVNAEVEERRRPFEAEVRRLDTIP